MFHLVAPEEMMVDREQEAKHRADDPAELAEHVISEEEHAARRLSDEDAEFERQMAIGRKVMDDHHAVLAELAK